MMRRLVGRVQEMHSRTRESVRLVSEVVDEHKTLLWLVGTCSSALAGWAVYVARRQHYEKIEGAMLQIREKITGMELAERERPKPAQTVDGTSRLQLVMIVVPSVLAAFLVGYVTGRFSGSYKQHRQIRVAQGLEKQRVYVAVIHERLFDSRLIARELERAVTEADKPPPSTWTSRFLAQRKGVPSPPQDR